MMMAIHPELVNAARLKDAHGPDFDIATSLLPSLKVFRTFAELTPSGVAGDARKASAAKGEALLAACSSGLAARLKAGEPWSVAKPADRR
jgi:creatinine amidohydrolase